MNRDDIIRMAREAGGAIEDPSDLLTLGNLSRFAALVAAAEREACAKLCNEADKSTHPSDLADAIRAMN